MYIRKRENERGRVCVREREQVNKTECVRECIREGEQKLLHFFASLDLYCNQKYLFLVITYVKCSVRVGKGSPNAFILLIFSSLLALLSHLLMLS